MNRYAALLMLFALLVPVCAFAGANQGAAILVETGVTTKTTACGTLVRTNCDGLLPVNQTAVGPNNYIAVYVGRLPAPLDIKGIDFGIAYSNAILVTSWNKCGDLDLPTAGWPGTGTGNSVIWGVAQGGNVVLVGWFKVTTYTGYGPMTFCAGPHPSYGVARVLDSASNFDNLRGPGCGSWDGSPGGNEPCFWTAVKQSTWGQIKNLYQN